ncbi:FliA/WhiG family RNA polymerase sigma factor [Candidatus Fukatsuia symbiotica]|uniref:RNA polymerase sigma factor FliA n=1 Tax=Candidatus Fukatsuia symbiotica TaxID=1878942 RepID=A0A2U8I6B0_9GAMM|nr:FliA/WhiG family RNA polymerase sigma factor [Candidatus Fukatsuia symbiotica]AWK14637.1 RNA polymerase sigma factor FliA [Candidatus Fukatsuia symbiotica]MEA9444950.1 FliA/WhiG family RNA polymerase sigma factor [Candidatus Fukatsuia symbiotica]
MCLKENIALTTVDEGKYLDIYLPLVKRVVRQLSFQADSVIEREDMQQIALMGLLEALRRYGHPDGQFAAYAVHRIRGAVLDQLREHDWRARRLRQKTHKTNEAIRELGKRLGHEPNYEEIAIELLITPQEYQEYLLLESAKAMESLDDLLSVEMHTDALQSRELEDQIIIQDSLQQAIATLDKREQLILSLYYQQELSLKEIALVLELTEARVCQLNKKITEKIKKFFSH